LVSEGHFSWSPFRSAVLPILFRPRAGGSAYSQSKMPRKIQNIARFAALRIVRNGSAGPPASLEHGSEINPVRWYKTRGTRRRAQVAGFD
jgi:hypothetical protein